MNFPEFQRADMNSCQQRPWCWERLRARGEGDDRGWDGWMASLPQWTGVWANNRRWWRTGKPGMLQSLGLQRVLLRDWTTTTIKGGAAMKPPEARLKEPERLIKIRRPPETLHMTYQQPHSWSNVIKLSIKSSQIGTYSFSRQKHSVSSFVWKSGKAILFCCCSSVLQSLSHAQLFAIPCTCNSMQQASLLRPPPSSEVCSNSFSLSQWCCLTISSSAALFCFCPQSCPASGSFPMNRSSYQVAKVLELHFQHQPFQWIFRTDFL